MNEEVKKVLELETPPKELSELLQRCKGLVKMSRDTMKDFYPIWDRADRVYRGERYVDEQDKKAMARGEPAKVIVPLSYAQVQTFVSFGMSMFTGRDFIFEAEGSGVEDVKPAKLAQACINRDLEYNKFKGVLLPQWLTDIGRFGLGIFKSDWTRIECPSQEQVPDPDWRPTPGMPNQAQPPMVSRWVMKPKYVGNRITVVNPYRWFPDVRLPVTRYREGEFCADETEYSKADLHKMESNGEVAGVKFVPKIPVDGFDIENRRSPVINRNYIMTQPSTDDRYILVTEVEIKINPAQTKIAENTVIDKDLDQEVVMFVWIANDSRIIKISDTGYEHNEFLYDAAQFFNDQTRTLNFGLSEFLGPSQDVLDWLMNSRITNVRKVIQNQLVVDPRFIELQDLKDRNPVIRLKSTASVGLALNTYVQQLAVTDVTTGHLGDMQNVTNFAEKATGISENMLGQYSSGRRSATQTQNVTASGAQRLVTIFTGLWDSGLLPLARKLLSNLRQGLDDEQLVRIIGLQKYIEASQPDPVTGEPVVRSFLPVNKSMLVGNYDFLVFDATLPSQRMATAAALQELLVALSKDPRLVLALGYDPKLILDEVLELRNVRNAQRFAITPQRAGLLMSLAGGAPNPGNAPTPGNGGGNVPPNGGAPANRPR